MDKLIRCDLCEKQFPESCKVTMINRINKNVIDICPVCFSHFQENNSKSE